MDLMDDVKQGVGHAEDMGMQEAKQLWENEKGKLSDEAKAKAEDELRQRGIDPQHPTDSQAVKDVLSKFGAGK